MRQSIFTTVFILFTAATSSALHLRVNGASGPAEESAPPASEDSASGPSGPAKLDQSAGGQLAATLLKFADQMEGKETDPFHKKLADAVVQATQIVGSHHATKVTLQQVVNVLKSMKEEKNKKKSTLPIKAIVEALRVPALKKKKKKKPDLKKLLSTAVNAVEGKLDQLEALLAAQSKKEVTASSGALLTKVEKSVEELSGLDMISGLTPLTPESELPKGMVVVPTRRGQPEDSLELRY
jgi:hypothetical protein